MTGFGRASAALANATLSVQISSVNRKALDLTVQLPEGWELYETEVAEAVRKAVARGKVLVRVELSGQDRRGAVAWDDAAVTATLQRLQALAEARGLAFTPTTEVLWQIAHACRTPQAQAQEGREREVLLEAVKTALRDFAAMRAREGAALRQDFHARLALLRQWVAGIAEQAPAVAPASREALLKRLRDAGLALDASDERVLKEVALFADRCDVSEEITRLRSHLEQMTALVDSEEEIGRKAGFLLQELGREINTIGSKANDLAIVRHVIEFKNELERMREQMANVE